MKSPSDQTISNILKKYKNIAIIGLSDSPVKPSNQVATYMQKAGFRIFPVNPRYQQVLGIECYPDLKSINYKIDIVNIFRPAQVVPPIVEEAIQIGAKVIWMQLGIVNEEAAKVAENHGLIVIMDRCIKIEHRRLHR